MKVRQSQREHQITLGDPLAEEKPVKTSLDILQQSTIPVQDFLTNNLKLRVLETIPLFQHLQTLLTADNSLTVTA